MSSRHALARDFTFNGSSVWLFVFVAHMSVCGTKTNNHTDEPLKVKSRAKAWRDDILLSNYLFGAVCTVGKLRPALIPRLAQFVGGSLGKVRVIDRSDHVFASPRLVRFVEMEYAIPRADAVAAITAVRDLIDGSGLHISFPVEVRFVAGDDAYLSPAHERDTCYIAVHVYRGMEFEPYFRGVEEIMSGYGGRPHWGKMHFQTATTLAPRYAQWDAFQAARRRVDPDGRFRNAYTDRVLGPVAAPS